MERGRTVVVLALGLCLLACGAAGNTNTTQKQLFEDTSTLLTEIYGTLNELWTEVNDASPESPANVPLASAVLPQLVHQQLYRNKRETANFCTECGSSSTDVCNLEKSLNELDPLLKKLDTTPELWEETDLEELEDINERLIQETGGITDDELTCLNINEKFRDAMTTTLQATEAAMASVDGEIEEINKQEASSLALVIVLSGVGGILMIVLLVSLAVMVMKKQALRKSPAQSPASLTHETGGPHTSPGPPQHGPYNNMNPPARPPANPMNPPARPPANPMIPPARSPTNPMIPPARSPTNPRGLRRSEYY